MGKAKARTIFLLFFFLFPFFTLSIGMAWDDWPDYQQHMSALPDQPGQNIGGWLAAFYRDHISPVDGSRCPSMPSCSSYSTRAFQKHGFFKGWVMTVDRLFHEGEEVRFSPLIDVDGEWKIFDPLENNDFWWFHEDEATKK